MERLIEKYNKECALSSKLVNAVWILGHTTVSLIFIFHCLKKKILLIPFLLFLALNTILILICSYVELCNIAKKLNIKNSSIKNFISKKNRDKIYQQFNDFQKSWITNYCKKNKIDTIQKLQIIRNELQQKKNNSSIKYINPIIIGTLLLSIWDKLVQILSEKIGFLYALIICFFLAICISMIIAWLRRECKEQKEFMNIFNRFSGEDKLNELLLYRILKSKK